MPKKSMNQQWRDAVAKSDREIPCSFCGDPDSLANYYENYRSYFDKTKFCCAQDAYENGFTHAESDKGQVEHREELKHLSSRIPSVEQMRASMTPTQIAKHREELLTENRDLKGDKHHLEGQVKHLTLKMEAMEIVEKILRDQIKDLIERHNALMDIVRQTQDVFEPASDDEDEDTRPRILVSVERKGNIIRKTYQTVTPNSKPSGGDSSGVVRPDARAGQSV